MCPPVCTYIASSSELVGSKRAFSAIYFSFVLQKERSLGNLCALGGQYLGCVVSPVREGGGIGRRMVKGGLGSIFSIRYTHFDFCFQTSFSWREIVVFRATQA